MNEASDQVFHFKEKKSGLGSGLIDERSGY